jgi:hypothetical protein
MAGSASAGDGDVQWLDTPDLLRWRSCPRRAWLHRHPPAEVNVRQSNAPTRRDDAALPDVQLALRASYPGASSVATPVHDADWVQAIAATQAWMNGPEAAEAGAVLLGACVCSDDGARARVDVLQRGTTGWRLLKLRLATAGREQDVDEAAWWAHVAARAGWRIQMVGLLLVNNDFIYPGHGLYAGVFREVDLGPQLGSRPVADWMVALRRMQRAGEPSPALGAPCTADGGCVFLPHCHANEPVLSIEDTQRALEVVGRDLAETLRSEGYRQLTDVPRERLHDPRHRRAWLAVGEGRPVVEPAVASLWRSLPRPRHLLRLETIGAAVPLWAGTRPYEVVPFQWTCATEPTAASFNPGTRGVGGAAGAPWPSTGFLADGSAVARAPGQGDPRRAFALSLLQALSDDGAVLAYNAGFERNRLRELARDLPDLSPALEALAARLVDLFQWARGHFYHPAMAGSWSARSLYRAVAPQVGAHGPVLEGSACEPGFDTPQDAFAEWLTPGVSPERRAVLAQGLRGHGDRQVRALQVLCACFEAAG